MLRRNENIKVKNSAKIICGERKREFFKKEAIERFMRKINSMPYGEKREDAKITLECLLSGRRIVLKDGRIYLYFERKETVRYEQTYTVTKNKELYSLLEDLVQS
jgi:hypothetical protein